MTKKKRWQQRAEMDPAQIGAAGRSQRLALEADQAAADTDYRSRV